MGEVLRKTASTQPFLLALALVGLQACAPEPLTAPDGSALRTFRFDHRDNDQSANATPMSVADIQQWGYAYVDTNCVNYFGSLQRARSQGELAASGLAAATTAATAILALAEATTKATGVTAAVLGLVASGISEYRRTILLTEYPEETSKLVFDAMANFRATAREPVNQGEALSQLAGYAELCSLSGIRRLARQAIAAAQTGPAAPAELTSTDRLAIAQVARDLGLTGLGIDGAAALLVYAEGPTNAARQQVLRDQLGSELTRAFSTSGGTLTPLRSDVFTRSIGVLTGLQSSSPALAARVQAMTPVAQTGGEGPQPASVLGLSTPARRVGGAPLIPRINVIR